MGKALLRGIMKILTIHEWAPSWKEIWEIQEKRDFFAEWVDNENNNEYHENFKTHE